VSGKQQRFTNDCYLGVGLHEVIVAHHRVDLGPSAPDNTAIHTKTRFNPREIQKKVLQFLLAARSHEMST